MSTKDDAKTALKKAKETRRKLLAMIADKLEELDTQGSGYPWCDLAASNTVNGRLAEAAGFLCGCEGSSILEEVSK